MHALEADMPTCHDNFPTLHPMGLVRPGGALRWGRFKPVTLLLLLLLGFGRAGGQTRARGGGVGQGRFAETHPAGPSERSPATRKTPGSARRAPQTGSIARQRHPPSTQGTPESLQPKPKGGGGLRQSATLGHSPRLPGGPFERRPCPVAPGAPAALPPSLQRARRLTGVTPRGPPAGKRGSGFTARGPETRG